MSDCPNCDNRKCMDCVFRVWHDECVDSCPECCPEYGEKLQAASDAEIRRIKAEAWDEGYESGEHDGAVGTWTYSNPHREVSK